MKQYKLYSVAMRSKILVTKLRFVVLEQKYKIKYKIDDAVMLNSTSNWQLHWEKLTTVIKIQRHLSGIRWGKIDA